MIYPIKRVLLVICLVLAAVTGPAEAARKLALVIGINNYRDVPKLEKAVGDATAIGQALTTLGFEVSTALDMDRRSLNLALAKLYGSIEPGDTVLIHYSGHGVQIESDNYLLPADVPAPDDGNAELLKSESIRLLTLVDTITAKGAGATILIIDACRDNPFATGGKRSIGATRGLANVATAKGTFIMYSAGAGQAALDKLGDSDTEPTSVYTRVLLSRLAQPDMKLRDLAASVRDDVEQMGKSVGHEQRPAYYDDLSADFSLAPGATGKSSPPPVVEKSKPPEPPVATSSDAREAWEAVKDLTSPAAFDAVSKRYAGTLYADLAKARAQELRDASKRKQQASVEDPPPVKKRPPVRTTTNLNWAVVLGSYPQSETSKARARLKAARAEGYDAQLINTDDYGRLSPGLYAVVIGASTRDEALSLATEAQNSFVDAYAKQLQ
jgi:Caspase domain